MKRIIRNSLLLFFPGILFFAEGCSKNAAYLNGDSGTWEIESMQLDYLNASGATDSTLASGITGFFMFYDTPTTGSDPYYLETNGITIRNYEQHTAHFWRSDGTTITLVTQVGQMTPDRAYTISNRKRNEMTLDYSGPANFMDASYSGNVKEHIVLKRIKF